MTIMYTIETGVIGADGNEYADEWLDSGDDLEGQAEHYIDIELHELRKQAELVRDVEAGEVFYKKLIAEKQDGDGYIEDSVTIDYEDESAPHDPPLTCFADLGNVRDIVAESL